MAEFLQGEIADRFLSETDVEGLRDHEAALAPLWLVVIVITISYAITGYCRLN